MTTVDTPPPAAGTPPPVPPTSAADPGAAPRRRRWRRPLLIVLALLIVVLAVVAAWYLHTRKPLSELPGLSEERMPHYAFSIYGTTHPLGVAVSPDGNRIYVAESDGERLVRLYDRSGHQKATLAPPRSTGAAHVPVYVAIDPTTGEVYVSDRMTAAIYVYDADGRYLRTFAPKGDLGGGWAPLGLAFDQQGRLYATDVRKAPHRILVFDHDGTLRRSLGASDSLSFPNGVLVTGDGTVAVSDSNNGRVLLYGPDGTVAAAINRGVGEGDLGLPRGIAVDDTGRLYVVDTANHTVRLYRLGPGSDPTPRYLGSFGDEGIADGRFEFPNGAAADHRGRVYLTDRENNRVQVWSY